MQKSDFGADNKYLFKRNNTWWVKVAVPRSLRKSLGYDLRRSLHTRDLNEARQARWDAIEEFRSKIETARAAQAAAASGAAGAAAIGAATGEAASGAASGAAAAAAVPC